MLPDPIRLADNGLSTEDLALSVDAFNDGVRIAEITVGGEIIDLMLMGPEFEIGTTQAIQNLPVVVNSGKILPVSSLAKVQVTTGPTAIWHRERQRAITVRIRPDNAIALGDVINIVRENTYASWRGGRFTSWYKISAHRDGKGIRCYSF